MSFQNKADMVVSLLQKDLFLFSTCQAHQFFKNNLIWMSGFKARKEIKTLILKLTQLFCDNLRFSGSFSKNFSIYFYWHYEIYWQFFWRPKFALNKECSVIRFYLIFNLKLNLQVSWSEFKFEKSGRVVYLIRARLSRRSF